MVDLSKEQILELTNAAGLSYDDIRAEIIAARLTTVLQVLDELPDDLEAAAEPLPIFTLDSEDRDD